MRTTITLEQVKEAIIKEVEDLKTTPLLSLSNRQVMSTRDKIWNKVNLFSDEPMERNELKDWVFNNITPQIDEIFYSINMVKIKRKILDDIYTFVMNVDNEDEKIWDDIDNWLTKCGLEEDATKFDFENFVVHNPDLWKELINDFCAIINKIE